MTRDAIENMGKLLDETAGRDAVHAAPEDIITRLKQYDGEQWETTACYNGLRDEAADLIEQLAVERAAALRKAEILQANVDRMRATMESGETLQARAIGGGPPLASSDPLREFGEHIANQQALRLYRAGTMEDALRRIANADQRIRDNREWIQAAQELAREALGE